MAEKKVSIVIQVRDATKGVLGKLKSAIFSLQGAFAGLTLGLVTRHLFQVGTAAEETGSKFDTVFGASAKKLDGMTKAWGRFAGLTRTETREFLASTGVFAQGMGIMGEASAAFSEQVARLSGDLASFHNRDIREVGLAINSALAGEREALKRLVGAISEADVKQKALTMTRKRDANEITRQEKAYATLALIQERAGVAVGDLDRTNGSLMNRYRRLKADIGNVVETIAVSLLPVFEELVALLNDNTGAVEAIGAGFVQGAEWALYFVDGLRQLVSWLKLAWAEAGVLNVKMKDFFGGGASQAEFDAAYLARGQARLDYQRDVANLVGVGSGARKGGTGDAFRSVFGAGTRGTDTSGAAYGQASTAEKLADEIGERLEKSLGEGPGGAIVESAAESIRDFLERAVHGGGNVGGVQTFNVNPLEQGGPGMGAEAMGELQYALVQAFEKGQELDDLVQGSLTQGFRSLGTAISSAFAAMVTGAQGAGEALKKTMLAAIGSIAKAWGEFFIARSIGAWPDFVSMGKYAAAAAGMFAVAGLATGYAHSGGGGFGGLSSDGFRNQGQFESANRGDAVIVIEGGVLDMGDPRQADALARALEDLSDRRVTIRGG